MLSKNDYQDLYESALKQDEKDINKFEDRCGYSIDKEWFNDLAFHTQVVKKKEELNFFHGRLLYSLLSKYINDVKPKISSSLPLFILETGTARGFSSLCMSKALNDNCCSGVITTIDCIAHQEKIYWNCIDDHEGPKTRAELLSKWTLELKNIFFIQGWTNDVLSRIVLNRINFAFLDAQHTKEDVLREFNYISKRQKLGDIVVFDDVTYSTFPGVCEALDYIEGNYFYKIERINFSERRGYAIATKLSDAN